MFELTNKYFCSVCNKEYLISTCKNNKANKIFCSESCRMKKYNATEARKKQARERHLKITYGIKESDLKNYCECCGTTVFKKRGRHADHNHKTGKFRGTLCSDCNMLIGFANDDVLKLAKAQIYLLERQ